MKQHLLTAALNAARKTNRAIALRPVEIEVLMLVWQNPGISLTTLVNELEYDRSTVTKAAAYLRKTLGLIQHHTEHTYVLTDAGADLCRQMDKAFFSML
jgi:DNA-binding MarR family transcriptional regulator